MHNKNIDIYHGPLSFKDLKETKIHDQNKNEIDLYSDIIHAISLINPRHEHLKCPAVTEWYKNTWIISQPFDMTLRYNSQDHKIESNIGDMLDLRPICKPNDKNLIKETEALNQEDKNNFYPEIQFKSGYIFWTKFPQIWIEMIPHPEAINLGLELTPSTYPISVWTRPTVFAFVMKRKDEIIKVPKKTKLYYIRFISKKHYNIKCNLIKRPISKNILLKTFFDTNIKSLIKKYSWWLIEKRLKNESIKSKCPFSYLFKGNDDDNIII